SGLGDGELREAKASMEVVAEKSRQRVQGIRGRLVEGSTLEAESSSELPPGQFEWRRFQRKKAQANVRTVEDKLADKGVVVGRESKLLLTLKETGYHIQLVWTPVRAGGELGDREVITSDAAVVVAAPQGISLQIPEKVYEGELLRPQSSYFGGTEGGSTYYWYAMPQPYDPSHSAKDLQDKFFCFARTRCINPWLPDIGELQHLAVVWTPCRSDGRRGPPVIAHCLVMPTNTTVKSVSMEVALRTELNLPLFKGQTIYQSGLQGLCMLSWWRCRPGLDGDGEKA
ncbi:hypothetical protein CYMTET_20902, partial [Cymbomonas tetramitiformis]